METRNRYGIGRFSPDYLQCCASIKIFAVTFAISALMTSTLSSYVASQITALEKQFGFTSTQSGFLMSCNDIGYLSLTLFVSYFAEKVHIPRTLTFFTLIFGLSAIVCSIPYFASSKYTDLHRESTSNSSSDYTSPTIMMISENQLCNTSSSRHNSTLETTCISKSTKQSMVGIATDFTPVAMTIIAIGMILQGFGKSPRKSYATIYIEDNVDRTKTSVYIGSVTAMAIFGPAIGFGLGGLFSQMYVTLEDVNISTSDPRWIGAWWLGYIIFGVGGIVTALPLLCFPRRFREKKITEDDNRKRRKLHLIGEFFQSIFGLFKNSLYVLNTVGTCLMLIIVSGSVAFGPKYIETQFTLPAWKTNLLIGITRVVAISVGTFIGGYFTSKKKLSPVACSKVIVILSAMSIFEYVLSMILGCDTPDIVGFNKNVGNLSHICGLNCNCDEEGYFPVCGSDGQNYFSPCHAGCVGRSSESFTNCSCIGQNGTSRPGLCSSNCSTLIPYMIVSCVFGLIESIAIMPSFIFMIRVVKEKEKSIAIAFSVFISTLLGWFLGPVIFGEIIDMCCKIWNTRCGSKGACALYDNVKFRIATYGFSLGMKFVVLLIDILTFLIARKKTDWGSSGSIQNVPEKETFITETEQTTNQTIKIDQNIMHQFTIKETDILT